MSVGKSIVFEVAILNDWVTRPYDDKGVESGYDKEYQILFKQKNADTTEKKDVLSDISEYQVIRVACSPGLNQVCSLEA